MLSRYQHVVDELRRGAADRMGVALWADDDVASGAPETTPDTKRLRRR